MSFKTEKEMNDALDELHTKIDPVPCASCTACCRGNQTVALLPVFGDDPARYPPSSLHRTMYSGEERIALKVQANGDCVFLRKGKCVVYDHRPAVCRNFDCRRIVHTSTPDQRRQSVEGRVFSQEIIDAGMERHSTMQLQHWEQPLYDNGYAEWALGGPNRKVK